MQQTTIITDTASLEQFCREAIDQDYIALDTEFLWERSYYPKLCLVQACVSDRAVIVDPLAKGIDLGSLFDLLVDPSIRKVFHAARQDLGIFHMLTGKVVTPVYDTQVGEMALCPNEQISYHALVKSYDGVELNKASRMTRWDKRPLAQAQIDYAFNDVIPLYRIYPRQRERLAGRESWIEETMQRLIDPAGLATEPREAWRLLKTGNLKQKSFSTLVAVAAWREEQARAHNLPRRWILSDESLMLLVQARPKDEGELSQLRLRPRKLLGTASLFEALHDSKPVEMPTGLKSRGRPVDEDLLQLFRMALHFCARKHNFAPRLLCSADELKTLASSLPGDPDWQSHSLQQGWRREIFGGFAEQIALGRVGLLYKNSKMQFAPLTVDADANPGEN